MKEVIINEPRFVLHVTYKVNQPKPYDVFAVIVPVPDFLVEVTPAPVLVSMGEIAQLLTDAVEDGLIQGILKIEPREYRRRLRRSEEVPDLPKYHLIGFALVSMDHAESHPEAYPQIAKAFGLNQRLPDA